MRNIRPAFNTRFGWLTGLPYAAIFYMLLGGREPWTLKYSVEDWFQTNPAWQAIMIAFIKKKH